MFGAIGDSAPDRWAGLSCGAWTRKLAEREGRAPRTLREMDFLLLVDDEVRAERFVCGTRRRAFPEGSGSEAHTSCSRTAELLAARSVS